MTDHAAVTDAGRGDENLWVFRLHADGRATTVSEWYVERPAS